MRYEPGTRALATATLVLLAATSCTTTGEPTDAKPKPSRTYDLTPAETQAPLPTPSPTTPGDKVDALGQEKGWTLPDVYSTASEYVLAMCDELDYWKKHGGAAQWLAEAQDITADEKAAMKAGVPLLCPEWAATVGRVFGGHYPRVFNEGTYQVGTGKGEMPPGRYRMTDRVEGCYWERTTRSGRIIANNFATSASDITVTIAPTDGAFTTHDCGTWRQQK